MLKPAEKEAKQILEDYFQNNKVATEIIEGSDPPDLIAILNGARIPVEVTQAFDKSLRNNELENRLTQDNAIGDICNSINVVLDNRIPSNRTLLLIIEGPAREYAAFKKSLIKLIQAIIDDKVKFDKLYSTSMKILVNDVPVRLKLLDSSPERKRISAIIANRNSIPEINRHVSLVLGDRIKDKEIKIHSINGEKWLVIINRMVLPSIENFVEAFSELEVEHTFTKIFLIDNSEVTELFSTC